MHSRIGMAHCLLWRSHRQNPRPVLVGLLAYGLLAGILYASLLPLWEGFDEAFHYAYVQTLSNELKLPVLGKSIISDEVWESLEKSPVSHIVERTHPSLMTLDDYFALDHAQRQRLRLELENIDPALRSSYSNGVPNYEAHQAPLAYGLLALPDRIWSSTPFPGRIWRLRVLAAIVSSCLMFWGTWRLGRMLEVARPVRAVALFLVFSTQMYYATIAHIANDWLAVPLATIFLSQALAFQQNPTRSSGLVLGAAYAAGLLTKAYFLAFAPLIIWLFLRSWRESRKAAPILASIVSVLLIAGPWYLRNLTLYGNLTGMQEATIGGLGPLDVIRSLHLYPWLPALKQLAHASLWTGNNSFTTFSADTVNFQLLLLLGAAVLSTIDTRGRGFSANRVAILVAGLSFAVGLAYAAVQSYLYTEGFATSVSPWYAQPLLAPILLLLLSGRWTSTRVGRLLLSVMVLVWVYVSSATYVVKLLPWYGGYGDSQVRAVELLRWYLQDFDRAWDILATLCPVDPLWLIVLCGGVCIIGWLVCFLLIMEIRRQPHNGA